MVEATTEIQTSKLIVKRTGHGMRKRMTIITLLLVGQACAMVISHTITSSHNAPAPDSPKG